MNSLKANRSRSKGISLVSPSSSKKKYRPLELSSKKIKIMQKKVSEKKENKQVKTERRNSFNPANYFSNRRISTKLF